MKDKDKEFILRLCKEQLHQHPKKAAQAQVMMRNIKPIKAAMEEAGTPFGDVTFDLVEKTVKQITKKYRITMTHIVVITSVTGDTQYSTGIMGVKKGGNQKSKSDHLITVHGHTLYEMMVKALLSMFVISKSNVVLERGEFDFKKGDWKDA